MTRETSHCQIVKVTIVLSIRKGLYANLDRQESNIILLSTIPGVKKKYRMRVHVHTLAR